MVRYDCPLTFKNEVLTRLLEAPCVCGPGWQTAGLTVGDQATSLEDHQMSEVTDVFPVSCSTSLERSLLFCWEEQGGISLAATSLGAQVWEERCLEASYYPAMQWFPFSFLSLVRCLIPRVRPDVYRLLFNVPEGKTVFCRDGRARLLALRGEEGIWGSCVPLTLFSDQSRATTLKRCLYVQVLACLEF